MDDRLHAPRVSRRGLLALGGALVLAACSDSLGGSDDDDDAVDPSRHDFWSSNYPEVELVGDSIFAGTSAVLVSSLEGAGVVDANVDAQPGRRIKVGSGENGEAFSGAGAIYQSIADGAQPSAWVIELGTNDIGKYPTAEEYAAQIDTILEMLPAPVPLVWMNVYVPFEPDHTDMFNMVLQDRIDQRGDSVVADWFAVASSPDADLLADTVHPNTDGQRAIAMIVLDALATLRS